MHPVYLIHTNRKTISLVPQLAPRPARPVERRDICQQHALSQRKNCSASSVIPKICTILPLVLRNKRRKKRKKQGENSGKKENTPRQPTASQERRTASEERRNKISRFLKEPAPLLQCTTLVCRCAQFTIQSCLHNIPAIC